WPQIRAVGERELGEGIGGVFNSVDPEPVATASLAQAHAARRRGGQPVILKVQRPGVDEQVTRDLEMIRRLTRRLESRAEWARDYHVAELGSGFADAMNEELDFGAEARNIAAIAAAPPLPAPRSGPPPCTPTSPAGGCWSWSAWTAPASATPGRCWMSWAPTARRWPGNCSATC